VRSCDSVSSRRAFSRFVIWRDACGINNDLQAAKIAKGKPGASNHMVE
tara:strand:- start:246 stop:389 length:144 start_codon:yes stop_codon:yes gene_type:complete